MNIVNTLSDFQLVANYLLNNYVIEEIFSIKEVIRSAHDITVFFNREKHLCSVLIDSVGDIKHLS